MSYNECGQECDKICYPRPWLCSFLAILIYSLQRETRWAGYQLLINCLQCTKKTSTKLVNQILVDHIWNNFQVNSCFYMTCVEKWSFSIFLVVATVHRIIIEVWSTQNPVVETMVVTDTMSGKWILVSFAIKRRGILNKWQSKLQYKIEYYMLSCLAPYSQVFNFNNYDNGLSWIVLYDVQDHEFCVIRRVIVMHFSSSVSESGVLKASKSVQNTVINSLFSHDLASTAIQWRCATNYCHNELVGGGWLCCRLVFTVTKWIHILMWDPLGWSSFFNG